MFECSFCGGPMGTDKILCSHCTVGFSRMMSKPKARRWLIAEIANQTLTELMEQNARHSPSTSDNKKSSSS